MVPVAAHHDSSLFNSPAHHILPVPFNVLPNTSQIPPPHLYLYYQV